MDKKYQVFISSTYTDLKVEREKVINAILKLEHIPIGMEMFNAGDDAQWSIIQRAIDNTDYYVLIIGFRYGSVTNDGISYTEKEYDYAVSKGAPVLAFIKDRDAPTAASDRESKPKYQKKLEDFITKVKSRETNFWGNADELAAQITSSLVSEMKIHPRTGWIRADFDPMAISQELAVLSKENRELRKTVDSISSRQPNIVLHLVDPQNPGKEPPFVFSYQRPTGNIHVRPLTAEEDLTDEISDLVGIKDLEEYNASLPSQEEIDEYNKQNIQYQNAQNNAHCFQLAIENGGNAQANNIYVDCTFPDGLLAYYDYDIGDIKKPKKLTLPSNPVGEALERVHGHPLGGSPLQAFLKTNAWINAQNASDFARTQVAPININRLRPGYYDRDYSIDENQHELTVQVDSLIHGREYLSDKIWFVASQKGKFTVECRVMCAEIDTPREYSFDIEFE